MKAAIIDIGSNSIRYLAGKTEGGRVLCGERLLTTTRLAANIDQTGGLCEASMGKSLTALEGFARRAQDAGLRAFAYATSAVRDADNKEAFLRRVQGRTGLAVDVLSTEREAQLALLGATGGDGGLIDIGGGSAQIATRGHSVSIPAGCVRLKDFVAQNEKSGAPLARQRDLVYDRIVSLLGDARFEEQPYTGVGGSITTLAALKLGLTEYRAGAVQDGTLDRAGLSLLVDRLFELGEGRRSHPLLTFRHDVILFGGMALEALMDFLRIPSIRVSEADGMEGYLLSVAQGEAPLA